jgi:hypothetical protein
VLAWVMFWLFWVIRCQQLLSFWLFSGCLFLFDFGNFVSFCDREPKCSSMLQSCNLPTVYFRGFDAPEVSSAQFKKLPPALLRLALALTGPKQTKPADGGRGNLLGQSERAIYQSCCVKQVLVLDSLFPLMSFNFSTYR